MRRMNPALRKVDCNGHSEFRLALTTTWFSLRGESKVNARLHRSTPGVERQWLSLSHRSPAMKYVGRARPLCDLRAPCVKRTSRQSGILWRMFSMEAIGAAICVFNDDSWQDVAEQLRERP
jgi:hypothetical protein